MEEYYKQPVGHVEVKLKDSCYNRNEGLFEVTFKKRKLLIPQNRMQFALQSPVDISSIWTILLDVEEIQDISIKYENIPAYFDIQKYM